MPDSDPAPGPLRRHADALAADPRWHALLRRHWPTFGGPGRPALSTAVHADDQMLAHSLRHHGDAGAALAQYFNVALQQHAAARQVLDALFPVRADAPPPALLDFACGFGRLVRFLVAGDRWVRLAVAEIQPDALAFVEREFGVDEVLPSALRPEDFDAPRRYDLIWVASLFSHLPAGLFDRWLVRLHGLLAPDGVLCFSVHDARLVPPGETMPADGLLFRPQSENADLDPEAYGTTHVTEARVRGAVARHLGADLPVHRLPRALAHEQDVYVVAARPGRDLSALAAFRRGPWGWVDERRTTAGAADGTAGELVLRGWAASIDDGALAAVRVRVRVDGDADGTVHAVPTGLPRADVRAAFDDDARLGDAGWRLALPWPAGTPSPWVEVTAHSTRGEVALLYAGTPGDGAAQAAPGPAPVATAPGTAHASAVDAVPTPSGADTAPTTDAASGGPSASATAPRIYARTLDTDRRSSLSVIAAWIAPGARVLDLGTGTGVLGRHLHEALGCTVDGLTLSAAERARAAPHYRQVVVGDLEDPRWPTAFAGRRYDAVVCADVLEHLRDPAAVLRACTALLADGGRLLVSVPNVAYAGMTAALMHGQWRDGDEGLLDRTHLRFFTRDSFERLLADTGWRVAAAEPIDAPWHHTEFWNRSDHLPPAVARYLHAQPGASAYQWVFAARPAAPDATGQPPGDAAPARPPPPPADPTVHVAAFVATLHHGPAGQPPRAVDALGRIGAERQTLAFVFDPRGAATACGAPAPHAGRMPAAGPDGDTAPTLSSGQGQGQGRMQVQVRLDPADRPGLMRLHALTLTDADGRPCWRWRADEHGDAPLMACRRTQLALVPTAGPAPYLVLALLGDDPQLDLPVPPDAWRGRAPWRLAVECGWPQSADYLALGAAGTAPALARRDDAVEVVVPVHGSLALAQRCVASVRAARGHAPWRLTVIDDASREPEVDRWLRALAVEAPEVQVFRQARNRGFVATVNHGMRLAGRRDVVLLNSDTEVADGWLDRLRAAAYAEARTGTATPFSNNATVCSWPRFCEDNALPAGWDAARLDALFARANAGRTVEIPTAVGFCMYLRRDCLDEVGEFDAATFGAGYGEENDFCRRAVALGWRHVHALDVFVRHAGAASFGAGRHALQATALAALRRLHPDYEDVVRAYVARDPARPFRDAVEALLGQAGAAGRPGGDARTVDAADGADVPASASAPASAPASTPACVLDPSPSPVPVDRPPQSNTSER